MILLTDEEIQELTGHTTSYEPKDSQINYSLREIREINKAQLKKVGEDLTNIMEDDAYYNHRIGAMQDYLEALLKELED